MARELENTVRPGRPQAPGPKHFLAGIRQHRNNLRESPLIVRVLAMLGLRESGMLCPEQRLPRRVAPALSILVLITFGMPPAEGHDAPKGWAYPFACCSGYDCREVPKKAIGEGPKGYVIEGTGEVVPYKDVRLHDSPDGEYHWCSVDGADNTRTICLFVPPKSY